MKVKGIAATSEKEGLSNWTFERREVEPDDVSVEILYCGICHSDIHMAKNEWGFSSYPVVPGHEILGKVFKVGSNVTKFKVGDTVGVGGYVDSCLNCHLCEKKYENLCGKQVWTYGHVEHDGKTPTYGGYSSHIVTKEHFVFKIPEQYNESQLAAVAPLVIYSIITD